MKDRDGRRVVTEKVVLLRGIIQTRMIKQLSNRVSDLNYSKHYHI